MSAHGNNDHMVCARTDAVLAVHLDGDSSASNHRDNNHRDSNHERFDRDEFGYGFVSDDSLHEHLRDCATCQQALQRARRLDAMLASTAGRTVVDHAVRNGGSIDDLTNRLLDRAIAIASLETDPSPLETAEEPQAHGPELVAATGDGANHTGTWIAALGVAAACLATWLCFRSVEPETTVNAQPKERLAAHATPTEPDVGTGDVDGDTQNGDSQNGDPQSGDPQNGDPQNGGPQNDDFTVPSSLARRMHAAQKRELPNQRTTSHATLAARVADRQLSVPERLGAARRLIQATRTGSMDAHHATRQLLGALASCGDVSNHELTVHDQLLEMLRNNHSFLLRIEQRVVAALELSDFQTATSEMFGAIVVAARVGDDRLDNMLRRALRRHDEVGDVVASALRCGVRMQGAAKLLLDCWHDKVAAGNQRNTAQWAEFWFRSQALTTFADLADLRTKSRSNAERVRCCLAMGCAADATTLPGLLKALKSPRRDEQTAAACGIAMLPHRVLVPLLPRTKTTNSALLRAALARAGLRQADRWLEHLALSKPQLRLLRTGSMRRFPEVVAWFRNALPVAD